MLFERKPEVDYTQPALWLMKIPPLGLFVSIIPRKCFSSLRSFISNISSIVSGDKQVVDRNRDVDVRFHIDIKAGVCIRSNEANFDEESMDLLILDVCCLFKAINGLQQSAYKVPLHPSSHKSCGLYHTYLLIQYSKQYVVMTSIPWISYCLSEASAKIMRYVVNFAPSASVSK